MENINKLLLVAEETALIGGEILRAGFGTLFDISSKEGKNNLVTEYDIKAEKAIIENILKHFPEHEILAEESGLKSMPKSSFRWIIDPLDGTVNFAHNIPIFSVSIACEKDGEIICGAIYHPLLNEMFTASMGGGAFLNGRPLKVSDNAELDNAILVTGFPYNISSSIVAGELFPNPATTDITLILHAPGDANLNFEIRSLTGQIAGSGQVVCHAGLNSLTVPITSIPRGMYLFIIHSSDGSRVLTKKLIKY